MSSFHTFAALLICMENSFWNHNTSGYFNDFMDQFKNSFTSYVKSGMNKKAEVDIDMLGNWHLRHPMTLNKFKMKLYQIIMGHYLSQSEDQAAA